MSVGSMMCDRTLWVLIAVPMLCMIVVAGERSAAAAPATDGRPVEIVAGDRRSAGSSSNGGGGRVVVAPPGITWSLVEVTFTTPRRLSFGSGIEERRQALLVEIVGRGFRPASTGPLVQVNGIPTARTAVSDDGSRISAWYFGETLESLEAAAVRQDGWELTLQLNQGAPQVYRVSPTGRAADIGQRPSVSQRVE